MRIAIATGTRADWGLLHPLALKLRNQGAEIMVVATNAHLSKKLGNTIEEIIADGFEPDLKLPAEGSAVQITSQAMAGIETWLKDKNPDCIIILGDRFEMLGIASAALLCGVPIVHIAGGTISEGAFDDSIRHAISKMATLHLVETEICRNRLIQMGEHPANVIVCGALGVYNALSIPLLSPDELRKTLPSALPQKFILSTLHPTTRSDASPLQEMQQMLAAFKTVMNEEIDLGVLLTYPNNDVDPAPQIKAINDFANANPGKVVVVPSLGRLRYLSAVADAKAVVGNSSSGIVEVASAGTPVVDIGIRQKGREAANSVLHVNSDKDSIAKGIRKVLSQEFQNLAAKRKNPYFKKDTPVLMAKTILTYNFSHFPIKNFYS